MCPRWKNDFSLFLADMGLKPSPTHSLDRIDVNGNYEPTNCRWATTQEQNANKRPIKSIEEFSDDVIEREYLSRFSEPEYGLSIC